MEDVHAALDSTLIALRAIRSSRPSPFIDTLTITADSALAAHALLRATSLPNFDEALAEKATAAAIGAIDYLLDPELPHLLDEDKEHTGDGYLADYAALIDACIAANAHTNNDKYIQSATKFADQILEHFAKENAIQANRDGATSLSHAVEDSPLPAPAPMAAQALLNLAATTNNDALKQAAISFTTLLAPIATQLSITTTASAKALAST